MLSFLNPIGLWLGALLAIPLVIHFLGRQRLRKEPFPSLMLIEERFAKSMHRHRLKNLLLLLIRTLLILCLLLALANPALEIRGAAKPGAESMAALVHNGAYGLLPDARGAQTAGGGPRASALERQRRRIQALDSAAGRPVRVVNLIAEGPGYSEAAARFGDPAEAVERLLAALDPQAPTAQIYLPAFAWEDLVPARDLLVRALKDRPGLQIVFWDFGEEGSRLSAFVGVRVAPSSQSPTVALRALLNPAAGEDGGARLRSWVDGRVFQETAPGEAGPGDLGLTEVTLPLSEGKRTAGRLAYEGRALFAVKDWHFCFPNPGRQTLAHAGSALASLPSLGRENYHRRIIHVAAAKDIPWQDPLRLVYLSNERNTDAAAYGRIVEFVKRGGRLIIGVGRQSDVPMLNRFLLQPLRLGRLGAVVDVDPPARAEADAEALARLGGLPPRPGPLGLLRKRFAFAPDSGTALLIRQGGEPVLAERDFQAGRALLWTTDLDDLEWSDLGVAPLVPLLHRAFQEGAGGLAANRAVDSDSLLTLDLPAGAARAEVRDPDGRPFTRVRAEGGRLRLGPFDKLGLHRAAFGADTAVFAVNLADAGPAAPAGEDGWTEWNEGRKAEFLSAFAPFKGRVLIAPPGDGDPVRASVRPLWRAFLLAAVLLLFLEGLVASAFALGNPDRRKAG